MRPDAITLLDDLTLRTLGRKQRSPAQEKRNFEYYMNRGYALNRDHGQCKICASSLVRENLETHHKNPFLPLHQIIKVNKMASLCTRGHNLVHHDQPNPFGKGTKPFTKLEKYRQAVKSVF